MTDKDSSNQNSFNQFLRTNVLNGSFQARLFQRRLRLSPEVVSWMKAKPSAGSPSSRFFQPDSRACQLRCLVSGHSHPTFKESGLN